MLCFSGTLLSYPLLRWHPTDFHYLRRSVNETVILDYLVHHLRASFSIVFLITPSPLPTLWSVSTSSSLLSNHQGYILIMTRFEEPRDLETLRDRSLYLPLEQKTESWIG